MSWVLRNKIKIFILFCLGVCFLLLGLIFKLNVIYYVLTYSIFLIAILLFYAVNQKMKRMYAPFEIFSNIRNVDYLLIGDFCDVKKYVPNNSTYVQIAAPGRSLNSSFQILQHTHSILKAEGGNVIITIGNSKKDFMIFDMPFLHPITIKKYHLERLKKMSKYTFVFSPIESIKFLIGGGIRHTHLSRMLMMN